MGDRSLAAMWDWFVHIPMLGAPLAWLAVMTVFWVGFFAVKAVLEALWAFLRRY